MAQEPVGGAKAQLLRNLDRAFDQLMTLARSHRELAKASGGRWGAFETLAHISGWHFSAARRLEQLARGEEPTPPGAADVMNAAFVAEREPLSRQALLAEIERGFGEMRIAVEAIPEREFWLGKPGEGDSLAYFIANANGPEHYQEHQEDLRFEG